MFIFLLEKLISALKESQMLLAEISTHTGNKENDVSCKLDYFYEFVKGVDHFIFYAR